MARPTAEDVKQKVLEAWPSDEALIALPAPSREQVEFLGREHDTLSAAIIANEDGGESRVNVFVGLVAAATAGLGLGADALHTQGSQLGWAVVSASGGLLLFGLATLRRLMQRNIATTDFVNGLRVMRAVHLVANRQAIDMFPIVPQSEPRIRKKDDWSWGSAGYVEIVALANASIAVVAVSVLGVVLGLHAVVIALVGVATAAAAWVGQIAWTRRVYARETLKLANTRAEAVAWWKARAQKPGETFRAGVGMLVARPNRSILVLERADVAGAWQLPQGGIERGEDPEQAAWRELAEEVGLTRDGVTLVSSSDAWFGYELPIEYRSPKTGRGQVHRWFLFRMRDGVDVPSLPTGNAEFRAARWVQSAELIARAVPFRQNEYRAVLSWLTTIPDWASVEARE